MSLIELRCVWQCWNRCGGGGCKSINKACQLKWCVRHCQLHDECLLYKFRDVFDVV